MRWAWDVAHMGMINEKKYFLQKFEGKKPLGTHRRRCEDNIKKDLTEIGWEDMGLIYLAQGREQWRALVYTVMNIQIP
jgi:hypothetical protein